jgi:predicted nucleic acid-binding Zn ribbon protein
MSEPEQYCVVCGLFLSPEQSVYDVRVVLDPMPPQGYACSERCAREAENAGKLRSYLAFDLFTKNS